MKLRSLHILTMPQFPNGFDLDLANQDGFILIVGPNGSGKSSICQALRATLWPQRFDTHGMVVDSVWEDQRGDFCAHLERGTVRWRLNGGPSSGPELPDASFAHSFIANLDHLEKPELVEEIIADQIHQEMYGGCDLKDRRLLSRDRTLEVKRYHIARQLSDALENLRENKLKLIRKMTNKVVVNLAETE